MEAESRAWSEIPSERQFLDFAQDLRGTSEAYTLYDLTGWRWGTFFARDDRACLTGSTLKIESGDCFRSALTRNPLTVFPVVNAEEV